MLSPFYHPVRFEYTNDIRSKSGTSTKWYPITTGINDPNAFINTVSGTAASGIRVRMTALDEGSFVSGLAVMPQYKQNPYYANVDINYVGDGKTNEVSGRQIIARRPYFLLNKGLFPTRFSIGNIAPSVTSYSFG